MQPPAAAPRADRAGPRGALPGDRRDRARAARPPLRRGGLASGPSTTGRGPASGRSAARPTSRRSPICEQALELLQTCRARPEGRAAELALLLALGAALRAPRASPRPEAGEAYRRARELCEELGDAARLFTRSAACGRSTTSRERWRDALRSRTGSRRPEGLADRRRPRGARVRRRGDAVSPREPAAAWDGCEARCRLYDEADRDAHIRALGPRRRGRGPRSYSSWPSGSSAYPGRPCVRADEGLSRSRAALAHPILALPDARASARSLRRHAGLGRSGSVGAPKQRAFCTRYGLVTHLALGTIAAGMRAGRATGRRVGLIRDGVAALRRTGGGFFIPLALVTSPSPCSTGDADAAVAAADEAVRRRESPRNSAGKPRRCASWAR